MQALRQLGTKAGEATPVLADVWAKVHTGRINSRMGDVTVWTELTLIAVGRPAIEPLLAAGSDPRLRTRAHLMVALIAEKLAEQSDTGAIAALEKALPIVQSAEVRKAQSMRSVEDELLGVRIQRAISILRSRAAAESASARVKPWLVPLILAGMIALGLTALLALHPAGLLWLYRKARIFALVDALQVPGVAGPLKLILRLTLLPLYVRHPRTLDAWVAAHLPTVRARFEREQANRSPIYVALPLRVDDDRQGRYISRPTAAAFSPMFSGKRSIPQIVGPGGAGKTTLGLQIGSWALAGGDNGVARHPILPVFIDEDTSDLLGVIRRRLRSWLDEDIEPELLDALLRKKRLLVLVDRLSERPEAMSAYIRTIHGSVPVGALIVTTREAIDFEAGDAVRVFPQPLDLSTLLYLMTSLLAASSMSGRLSDPEQQLELGKRLLALLRPFKDGAALTPLLVKLYVDRAVMIAESGGYVEELPATVPDAYFAYLRQVNPSGASVPNAMSDEDMLRAAKILARLATEKAFVPREFALSRARMELAARGWTRPEGADPVRRLTDNGVLQTREAGADHLLRFVLDPVAEFLAAMSWAEECGTSAAAWENLFRRVDAQSSYHGGFETALMMICRAYGAYYGWGCNVERPVPRMPPT